MSARHEAQLLGLRNVSAPAGRPIFGAWAYRSPLQANTISKVRSKRSIGIGFFRPRQQLAYADLNRVGSGSLAVHGGLVLGGGSNSALEAIRLSVGSGPLSLFAKIDGTAPESNPARGA